MNRPSKLVWAWVLLNLVLLFGVPGVYGWWLSREVAREYATGLRVSTDGDSLGLPIGDFFLKVATALLTLNGLLLLVRQLQLRRSRRAA